MSLCGNDECFGLEPCPACLDIRWQCMQHAIKASLMTSDQTSKFMGAYAEAFDGALVQIKRMQDELRERHLAEKAAREKEARAPKEAETKPNLRKQERPSKTVVTDLKTDKNGTSPHTPQTPKPEEKAPASDLKP